MPLSNSQSFKAEARWQRLCAECDKGGAFQAHHVIYEQHLRDRGLPLYDTRNALRLCYDCHKRHHDGTAWRLTTRKLTPDNIIYAFEVLGAYAGDYLRRYYDDLQPDVRICEQEQLLAA